MPRRMRTIALELKDFAKIPVVLIDSSTNSVVNDVKVPLKDLFHHYFLAKYGNEPDPGVYEYERALTSSKDWRFKGSGIGADKESKRNASNELAKGFARWFLYEHEGHTYFAPLEHELKRKRPDKSKWVAKPGDLPDYVCGPNRWALSLLEVKGRYSSISFGTKEFDSFREQVGRVTLHSASGAAISVKGYISVARWATETTPKTMSKLLVEDPRTDGAHLGPDDNPGLVGLTMIASHYADALDSLQLPLHANALRTGDPFNSQIGVRRWVWRVRFGTLKGREFIGGILPEWVVPYGPWLRWELALLPPMTFFGLEFQTFAWAQKLAALGVSADSIGQLTDPPVDKSSTERDGDGPLSLFRDGTILGPMDYFEPVRSMEL